MILSAWDGLPSLVAMTEWMNPELFVKKRTFFPSRFALARSAAGPRSATPAAARRTWRRFSDMVRSPGWRGVEEFAIATSRGRPGRTSRLGPDFGILTQSSRPRNGGPSARALSQGGLEMPDARWKNAGWGIAGCQGDGRSDEKTRARPVGNFRILCSGIEHRSSGIDWPRARNEKVPGEGRPWKPRRSWGRVLADLESVRYPSDHSGRPTPRRLGAIRGPDPAKETLLPARRPGEIRMSQLMAATRVDDDAGRAHPARQALHVDPRQAPVHGLSRPRRRRRRRPLPGRAGRRDPDLPSSAHRDARRQPRRRVREHAADGATSATRWNRPSGSSRTAPWPSAMEMPA